MITQVVPAGSKLKSHTRAQMAAASLAKFIAPIRWSRERLGPRRSATMVVSCTNPSAASTKYPRGRNSGGSTVPSGGEYSENWSKPKAIPAQRTRTIVRSCAATRGADPSCVAIVLR